jgi:SAM-dependent methyltransferase
MTTWTPVRVPAPPRDAMVWVDGLRHLSSDYLARYFRPQAQGLEPRTVALALRGADPAVARHVLRSIDPELAASIHAHGATPATAAEVFAEQLRLVTVYFWEMIYHGHPEIYELFSAAQQPPLDEMFPVEAFRGLDVADIGTGGGRVLVHLAPAARRLWGIDPCPALMELAAGKLAGRAEVTMAEGGFDRIPLPDAAVDAVVSHGAYQVSEERGGLAGLAEVRRVLRPGGRALLAVANPATARHLRSSGVTEIPVSSPIAWTAPAPGTPELVHRLLDLAQVRFEGRPTATTGIWLFAVPA